MIFTLWSFSAFGIGLRPWREWEHPGAHVIVVVPHCLLPCLYARMLRACSFPFWGCPCFSRRVACSFLAWGNAACAGPYPVDVSVQQPFGIASPNTRELAPPTVKQANSATDSEAESLLSSKGIVDLLNSGIILL
jgi:hypothetical protein